MSTAEQPKKKGRPAKNGAPMSNAVRQAMFRYDKKKKDNHFAEVLIAAQTVVNTYEKAISTPQNSMFYSIPNDLREAICELRSRIDWGGIL